METYINNKNGSVLRSGLTNPPGIVISPAQCVGAVFPVGLFSAPQHRRGVPLGGREGSSCLPACLPARAALEGQENVPPGVHAGRVLLPLQPRHRRQAHRRLQRRPLLLLHVQPHRPGRRAQRESSCPSRSDKTSHRYLQDLTPNVCKV